MAFVYGNVLQKRMFDSNPHTVDYFTETVPEAELSARTYFRSFAVEFNPTLTYISQERVHTHQTCFTLRTFCPVASHFAYRNY